MDRNRLIASLLAPTAALIALACSDSDYEPLLAEGGGGTSPGTGGVGATPTTGGAAATGGDPAASAGTATAAAPPRTPTRSSVRGRNHGSGKNHGAVSDRHRPAT
jgi:hypothetical protein